MKLISLTQGQFAQVDDIDFDFLNQYKWCAQKAPHTWYAIRFLSVKNSSDGKQHAIKMHQQILGKPLKGFETLHKDGNGLNNQRDNLRIATKNENQQEQRIHRNGKLPGVSFHKASNKWRAYIKINDKSIHLGLFLSKLEAHRAYIQYKLKHNLK